MKTALAKPTRDFFLVAAWQLQIHSSEAAGWQCSGCVSPLLKAVELEIFEIVLSGGMLTLVFVIAGFCELVGER